MWTTKTLIRMGGCPGGSESSLGAQPLCWFCHVAAHLLLFQMYLCSSCKISQNIYIFSLDTEIQNKNGDLKFGDKHRNFMQMAIPVTVFHL